MPFSYLVRLILSRCRTWQYTKLWIHSLESILQHAVWSMPELHNCESYHCLHGTRLCCLVQMIFCLSEISVANHMFLQGCFCVDRVERFTRVGKQVLCFILMSIDIHIIHVCTGVRDLAVLLSSFVICHISFVSPPET